MAKVEVPVTPELLTWAIDESGYDETEVAEAAGVSPEELAAWERAISKPTLTQARKLATFLHRTLAFFLLPKPPKTAMPTVQFRHPPSESGRETLNPEERRHIRKAQRLQRVLAWVATELGDPKPALPKAALNENAYAVAEAVRSQLEVPPHLQLEWQSGSIAFDQWRERLEKLDILVFLFSIGKDSCRGFSIWHDRAPLIAVNTAWNEEARIFTLFHELGHLVTRTNSACGEGAGQSPSSAKWDPAERWCEQFAAGVLLPAEAVRSVLSQKAKITDVAGVRWVASRFKTSLRATTLRLIELGFATWELYDQLPIAADIKRPGGGAGGGRVLREIREDQVGHRATSLFRRAVDADVMSRTQALSYLDVGDGDFEQLVGTR